MTVPRHWEDICRYRYLCFYSLVVEIAKSPLEYIVKLYTYIHIYNYMYMYLIKKVHITSPIQAAIHKLSSNLGIYKHVIWNWGSKLCAVLPLLCPSLDGHCLLIHAFF